MSTKIKLKVYKCLNIVQNYFLPGFCVVCNKDSYRKEDICIECELKLPTIDKPCSRCALPLPYQYKGHMCGSCIIQPPPFHYSTSPFEYQAPINSLISQFKDYGKLCNGRVMANLLGQKLEQSYQSKPLPQLIIPVPIHHHRLRHRAYNQASEIARHLAHRLNISINHHLCKRIKDSASQRGLNAKERQHNLKEAFAISNQSNDLPKSIAIVDDVVTTMSTVTELSKLFLKHGVDEIHIWSIARTCK